MPFTKVKKRILSKQYPESLLASLRKEYMVRGPVVWSQYTKNLTLRAARNVRIAEEEGKMLLLVIEPETEALYALKTAVENGKKVDIEVREFPYHVNKILMKLILGWAACLPM